jgi:Domain of unknown function (DUF1707)
MTKPAPDAPALRVSDADRDSTAAQLRAHYEAGRVTSEELDERTDAAFRARTAPELRALLSDLPLPSSPATPRRLDLARADARRRVLHRAGWLGLLSLASVVVWLATGANSSFWPQWVLLLAAIRLAFYAWSELGPGAPGGRARS